MLLPYQNAIRTLELNYNTTINNKLINDLSNKINITDVGITQPAKAMPDMYKVDDVIQSYRNYYMGEKQTFTTWKDRTIPNWFKINPTT